MEVTMHPTHNDIGKKVKVVESVMDEIGAYGGEVGVIVAKYEYDKTFVVEFDSGETNWFWMTELEIVEDQT
jgi:hypothetical protein